MTLSGVQWPRSVHVLIPAYRAAQSLAVFLPEVLNYVPAQSVWVVDDGSGDETRARCTEHGVTCISHKENKGKGAALRTGFSALLNKGVQWIITMDADGQHRPKDLTRFLAEMEQHPESAMIIGSRMGSVRTMPLSRIVSNTLTSGFLSLVTMRKIADSQSGYRAYRAAFLRETHFRYDRFEMETEAILRAAGSGHQIRFVPIQTVYSRDSLRTSHITHGKDTFRWIRAVLVTMADRRKTHSLPHSGA